MAFTWLSEGDAIEEHPSGYRCLVGTPWAVTEYPNRDKVFYGETLPENLGGDRAIYSLVGFSWATKIGGHIPWLQGDETPVCSRHGPMSYVGQFFGGDIELGDSGVAYVFVCPDRGCHLTKAVIQCM